MLIFILCVVAPVDHNHDEAEVEVRVKVLPVQKVNGPSAVIIGISGKGLTVTMVAVEAALWHPFEFVTLTE